MIRRLAAALVVLIATISGPTPALAERLIVSLSTHRVQISSNFRGVDLTLFGAIEQDAATVGRTGTYSIVVTVIGPRQTTVVWEKKRIMGLWVNASYRTFLEPPSYLAVLSNRPIEAFAPPEARQRLRLGLHGFLQSQSPAAPAGQPAPDEEYRRAFVAIKKEQRLYHEYGNAVTFITPSLFRTAIPLPANVAVGTYQVETKLFVNGSLIARDDTAFEIVKTGFEQFISESARNHGLLYGLATTMLALFTGWLGSIVFRRD